MELRHLRYFVAVAEEQHMTRAAARLGLQQPPLSQQIRALERELGVALFERTPRSIRLNGAGRLFLHDARALLRDAEAAATRVRQAARGELGRVAVGHTSSAVLHPHVPQVLRLFREQHPQITLDVREDATDILCRAVLAEEIDAAFVRALPTRYPALLARTVCEEEVVVALPAGHRLAEGRGPLALSALAAEDFVLYKGADEGPGVFDVLGAACLRAGFNPHAALTVPRLLSAAAMVAAGRGITVLPRALEALHQGAVVYRPLDAASRFTIPLTLVWRATADNTPLARFVETAGAV